MYFAKPLVDILARCRLAKDSATAAIATLAEDLAENVMEFLLVRTGRGGRSATYHTGTFDSRRQQSSSVLMSGPGQSRSLRAV
jgi:hypothetical protein